MLAWLFTSTSYAERITECNLTVSSSGRNSPLTDSVTPVQYRESVKYIMANCDRSRSGPHIEINIRSFFGISAHTNSFLRGYTYIVAQPWGLSQTLSYINNDLSPQLERHINLYSRVRGFLSRSRKNLNDTSIWSANKGLEKMINKFETYTPESQSTLRNKLTYYKIIFTDNGFLSHIFIDRNRIFVPIGQGHALFGWAEKHVIGEKLDKKPFKIDLWPFD